eukprot:CAMPEP_0174323324 /NCGR_PEP_ID=MMETSP0810-20121108/11720_1 /TAXON_ID=73025 ORGANISM="Eutreptiella gymnastica-like, Strain CCMP1594" /NCGR_SAMPLE_ID=MMETSP0810 /ASSEMBLY_ACC=CAM_ASM_000659 /LENGTH=86 /DNA_ID=CAMNT_0015435691 /DNA_START=115 /DNA_END=375 /DNA_ORIENTATION=-
MARKGNGGGPPSTTESCTSGVSPGLYSPSVGAKLRSVVYAPPRHAASMSFPCVWAHKICAQDFCQFQPTVFCASHTLGSLRASLTA